ncbi:MAG: hypothetical protein H0U77_05380, partial [Nocardioidaceae bacterium]|nr:hypothetical protein [Nocardioidaceae bacterium]
VRPADSSDAPTTAATGALAGVLGALGVEASVANALRELGLPGGGVLSLPGPWRIE